MGSSRKIRYIKGQVKRTQYKLSELSGEERLAVVEAAIKEVAPVLRYMKGFDRLDSWTGLDNPEEFAPSYQNELRGDMLALSLIEVMRCGYPYGMEGRRLETMRLLLGRNGGLIWWHSNVYVTYPAEGRPYYRSEASFWVPNRAELEDAMETVTCVAVAKAIRRLYGKRDATIQGMEQRLAEMRRVAALSSLMTRVDLDA